MTEILETTEFGIGIGFGIGFAAFFLSSAIRWALGFFMVGIE